MLIGRTIRLGGVALMMISCGSPSHPPPDGGPPRLLEVLVPPGTQIGLRYGQAIDLRVRHRLDDVTKTPVAGTQVKFAIFDDPGGSTLAQDRATTDGDGIASVKLTAGAQERSFRVRATADSAPDAEMGVTVSRLEFVNLDVQLAWPVAATLEALLYVDRACGALPPRAMAEPAFRMITSPGPGGTLAFLNLLQRGYALVGRAVSSGGKLLAYGCVDVSAALVPGGTLSVPVPLASVTPSLEGSYALTTTLTLPAAAVTAAAQPWRALTTCSLAPAQGLLDEIHATVASGLKTAIDGKRGTADANGCRPAMAAGMPSLDAQLQTLLTPAGSPGLQLPAIVSDLVALLPAATLASKLAIAPAGGDTLAATHTLSTVTLAQGATKTATYDVSMTGLPLIESRNVRVTPTATGLPGIEIGAHGFTLGLGRFWRRALGDLAIAPRLPAVTPPTARALLGAVVAAASRPGGKVGCAAVEDLVCTVTGAAACTGAVDPACTAALDTLADALEAPFQPPTAIDFPLSGVATTADSDGDLLVDKLGAGVWTSSLAATAPFTGDRQ